MLQTLLRILKHWPWALGVGVLWLFIMFVGPMPLLVFFVLCVAAANAWSLWSWSKWRRARARELARAFEDKDLSSSMREWLDSATRGLGAIAKKRIAKDIGSHYLDARAAAVEGGLPAPEAELRAIKILGNPRSARRGFRKVYLTKREETWIRKMYNPGSSRERHEKNMAPIPLLSGFLLCGIFLLSSTAFEFFVKGESISGFSVTLYFMFVVAGACTWLQYRWMHRGWARRAKATELLGLGILGFIVFPVMIVLSRSSDSFQWIVTALASASVFCAFAIVQGVSTLGKLPKDLSAEERRFFKRES